MSRRRALSSRPDPRPAQSPGRRDFLALGALAASLPVTSISQAHGSAESLPVGFWDGAGDGGALRSAQSLLTGDAAFGRRGIRLSVLGLAGPRPRDLLAVHLVSHAALPGLRVPLDVVHWGMRVQATDSIAGISNQVVATGADAALRLTLEVRWAQESQKRSYPLVLSSGWMPGSAKLRRGTYLLAFDHTASPPRWADHRAWLPDAALKPRLTAPDCACLMLAVDYAG